MAAAWERPAGQSGDAGGMPAAGENGTSTGPAVIGSRTTCQGKWMSLRELQYRQRSGAISQWEYVARRDSTPAVVVMAEYTGENGPELVLIRQFRPPMGAWVWEFPAGLVDPDEDPAAAALRELAEETGFLGEVERIGPPVASSAGLTSETVRLVRVRVTARGEARPEGTEAIEVHLVPVASLRAALLAAADKGDAIDAKLWMLAEC